MVIDDLQNGLFHHLSRDGGQADLLVVSQVFLLALFKDGSDTGLPPVIRHLSHSPWFFKGGGEQQSNNTHQLPQNSWGHPIRFCGFMHVKSA